MLKPKTIQELTSRGLVDKKEIAFMANVQTEKQGQKGFWQKHVVSLNGEIVCFTRCDKGLFGVSLYRVDGQKIDKSQIAEANIVKEPGMFDTIAITLKNGEKVVAQVLQTNEPNLEKLATELK